MTAPEAIVVTQAAPKPCPFCGTDDDLVIDYTRIDDETTWWGVSCHRCGCEIGCRNSEAEAIAAWNTRASEERIAGLVEALGKWPCGECHGSGVFHATVNGAFRRSACFSCKGTGVHRIARAALATTKATEGEKG